MKDTKYIFALITLALFCLFKPIAKAQQIDIDYYSPKEYEVGEIKVTGADNLDVSSVILLSGISLGEKIMVPSDKFATAIDRLWKQGMFDDIHIYITKVQGKTIFLEYALTTKPRLSSFNFKGVSNSEANKIRERLHIMMGDFVTDNLKANCENIINDYFVEKGFYNISTNIVEIKDTASRRNEVHLTFEVNKGKKIHIGKIATTGNEFMTNKQIRRKMKNTKEQRWWRFWKSSRYTQEDYKEDKDRIVELYNNEGYRDARITWDTVYVQKKDNKTDEVIIKMNIFEGKKYYFRNITWVGNTKYTSKELSERLRINKGDVYNKELLQTNISYDPTGKDISSLYMDDGYLFFRAIPVEINVENDSIDIEMRIYEGNQAIINNVDIKGNTRTNDFVIRRELRTIPGELFSRDDLIRSVRELGQMGYFNAESIVPKVEPNAENGTVDITYELEEDNKNNQISASAGWGGHMVIGTLGLQLTNFSMRKLFDADAWTPFPVGDGQRIGISFQTNGSYYYSGSLSFAEPWLGGRRPNSLSTSVYYTYQDDSYYYDVSNYHIRIIGASVSLGRRLAWPDDYFTFSQGLKYQLYDVKNASSFIMSTGKANNLAYTMVIARNSTDQYIYPRSGSDLSIEGSFTFPYSLVNGKDYSTLSIQDRYRWLEYYKIGLRAAWYVNIFDNLVLSARSRFGFLGRYNKDIDYSPFERYYLGGDGLTGYALDGREVVALRGYEASALAPDNGATVFDKFTLEMRYPITLSPSASIYVLGFIEGGNSWSNFDSFAPFKMYRSAGAGIRIFMTMFGLLGFDYGYGFDPAFGETQRSKGHFHISIGQSID